MVAADHKAGPFGSRKKEAFRLREEQDRRIRHIFAVVRD
jgi:hypothetical protein